MKKPFFTIIVVSYNAGDKLLKTVRSITSQTFTDYRILVKDGMSTDGSVEKLKASFDVVGADTLDITKKDNGSRITLLESCDNGIYHAMNIATAFLDGKIREARAAEDSPEGAEVKILKAGESPSYIFFLNCGDYFRNENVLRDVHRIIQDRNSLEGTTLPVIYYGDIFDSTTGNRVASNPKIDDLACYRNVPSHQACFYDERLIYRNPFDLKYRVRADYEQFLRCFYREKAETVYMPVLIADYEGGGFSDKNRKISEQERREIILMYLPAEKVRKYDLLRAVTLAPLRTALAGNKITAGAYNSIKSAIYAIRKK
ncbi:MAG: glycosyltransferase [Butyrivibrio sp.]|nr:glycosyltransferase [Butyrivibrio sp.]